MFQIDKSSTRPMYQQIIDSIIDQIQHGHLKYNDRLPTEDYCQHIYGISNVIVKKAYGELHNRGFIARKRGLGTYVCYKPNLIVEMALLPNLLNISSRIQVELLLKERLVKEKTLFSYKFLLNLDEHVIAQQEIVNSVNLPINQINLYREILATTVDGFSINKIEAKSADDSLSFALRVSPGSAVTLVVNQSQTTSVKTYLNSDLIQISADAYGN